MHVLKEHGVTQTDGFLVVDPSKGIRCCKCRVKSESIRGKYEIATLLSAPSHVVTGVSWCYCPLSLIFHFC